MKRKRIVIFASIVALGAAFVAFRSGEKDFQELLEYEAENRAFALLWTQEAARETQDPDAKAFWEAYAQLELLNQEKYAPHLAQHGIAAEPGRKTRTAVWASGFVLSPESSRSIEFMRNAARDYVCKLERLQSLATDNEDFYSYVVAQEQVQADALSLAVEGDLSGGTEAFTAFVEANQD